MLHKRSFLLFNPIGNGKTRVLTLIIDAKWKNKNDTETFAFDQLHASFSVTQESTDDNDKCWMLGAFFFFFSTA